MRRCNLSLRQLAKRATFDGAPAAKGGGAAGSGEGALHYNRGGHALGRPHLCKHCLGASTGACKQPQGGVSRHPRVVLRAGWERGAPSAPCNSGCRDHCEPTAEGARHTRGLRAHLGGRLPRRLQASAIPQLSPQSQLGAQGCGSHGCESRQPWSLCPAEKRSQARHALLTMMGGGMGAWDRCLQVECSTMVAVKRPLPPRGRRWRRRPALALRPRRRH